MCQQGRGTGSLTLNIDFLLKVIDHRIPSDPKLEEFLQKMVQKEIDRLFLSLMPPLNPFLGADKKVETRENKTPLEQEIFRASEEESPCSERKDLYFRESFRFGMVYAYAIRVYLFSIYDLAINLNAAYYKKEIKFDIG